MTEQTETTKCQTIDITPTWGQVGLLFKRLALSGERKALQAGASEMARAFAMAQALKALLPTLSEEQKKIMAKEISSGLTAQGY